MSAYLTLVVHAAQTDAHVVAVECSCDALAQTCLAHAWRAVEADDWALEVILELQHSQVLQDTLLHLLHAVVVLVQAVLCALEVQRVLGTIVPWKAQDGLQIVELHVVVGRLYVDAVQLGQLLLKGLFHLLAPLLVLGLLLHALLVIQSHAGVVLVAQLVLQLSDFLAKEVFALLLVYLFLCAALYLLAQTCQLHQAVQVCQSLLCPLGLAGGRQHLVLHVVTYGQVAAYHVEHER